MSRSIIGRRLAAAIWIGAVAVAPNAPSRIAGAVAVVFLAAWIVADLAGSQGMECTRSLPG